MKTTLFFLSLLALTSCIAVNMNVPNDFKNQSTRLPVSGMNGWMVKQKLSFGNFQTSAIRRGWDFNSSVQYSKFRLRPEEYILKVYDIDTDKRHNNQKHKFQYTINDRRNMMEVYATEKFNEKQLVYKSNNPWIGQVKNSVRYDYSFTASIIPLNERNIEPWSLVLISRYDRSGRYDRNDKRRYMEEEGYATNGRENFAISPLRSETLRTYNGEERKILGGKLFTGYEISKDNEVIAAIDIIDNAVWIHNRIDPSKKLLIASIASAILLKRVHDTNQYDREDD